jgi:hypothetical protein
MKLDSSVLAKGKAGTSLGVALMRDKLVNAEVVALNSLSIRAVHFTHALIHIILIHYNWLPVSKLVTADRNEI